MNTCSRNYKALRKTLKADSIIFGASVIFLLLLPANITWFNYLYAAVGFGFTLWYLVNMVRE